MNGSSLAVELEAERVRLRLVRSGDAPALLRYYERNREHLERWEPSRPPDFYTLAYWQTHVENVGREQSRGERRAFLAFARDPAVHGSEPIASVNLHRIVRGVQHSALLGYSADAAVVGRGLAREAVAAVVRYAFDDLGLHRIEANYQPNNERSGKLLKAIGFVVEGYARDYLFLDGAWRDHVLTSITNPGARVDP